MITCLAPFANPPIRVGLADRFLFTRGTLHRIAQQRSLPTVNQIAIAIGVVLATAVAVLLREILSSSASTFGIAAPLCGIALGAFVAGKVAKNGSLFHGALVGVGYVLVEAIGIAPAPLDSSGDGLAEGLSIIAGDALLLALAALAGWAAAPRATSSSSSGTGRGR